MGPTPLGRRFYAVLTASGISNLADGLLLTGAPIVAATLTRSPLLVSLATTFVTLPWLLLSLHAGAFADRWDRRRIMLIAGWSRAFVLLCAAAAALAGVSPLPVLYAVVFLASIGEVCSDVSSQSIIPLLVDRKALSKANGRLIATQRIANDFLAGPLAGVLAAIGAYAVFGISGVLFVLSAFAMLRLKGTYKAERAEQTSVRADIVSGLSFLAHHRILRSLAILAGTLNLGFTAYDSLFVLWVVGEESAVGLSPATYGLLITFQAAGAVLGSLAAEWTIPRIGETRAILCSGLFIGLLLLIPLLLPNFWAIAAKLFLSAYALGTMNVANVTLRQRLIPTALLGRVNASFRMIGMGTMPVAGLLGGLIGTIFGLPAAFLTATGIVLLGVLIASPNITTAKIAAAEQE